MHTSQRKFHEKILRINQSIKQNFIDSKFSGEHENKPREPLFFYSSAHYSSQQGSTPITIKNNKKVKTTLNYESSHEEKMHNSDEEEMHNSDEENMHN